MYVCILYFYVHITWLYQEQSHDRPASQHPNNNNNNNNNNINNNPKKAFSSNVHISCMVGWLLKPPK